MDLHQIFHDSQRKGLLRDGTGEVVDEDGWLQVTTRDAPVVWRNYIQLAVLERDEADARIEAVKTHYEALGLPFLWRVTPACRPTDLGERLRRAGFAHFETLCCLTADPVEFPEVGPDGPNVEAVDASNASAYLQVSGDGWNMPPAGRARFKLLLERELARSDRTELYYLARIDGDPVGTASMSLSPHSVHFNGGAVPALHRAKGIYRALILHRMKVLREMGRDLVTVCAVRTTSAPICRRMGFEERFRIEAYCYPASEADRD